VDFELTEEQEFFAQTTRKFLAAECPITAVRALEHNADGFDRAVWRRGCELGWTSMLVSEADGGGSLSGAGLRDLALVAELFGESVAPGPLAPTNVVAALLSRRGTDEQKAAWLPGLLDGSIIGAWVQDNDDPVEAGAQADVFVVSSSTGNRLVAAGDASVTALAGLDLVRRFARVAIGPDAGEPLGTADTAAGDNERALQIALVVQNAETCGALSRMFNVTLDYLGDRYSFGRPLSSYQALKHRVADNKMHLEACLGIADMAARAAAEEADNASEFVSAAKAFIGAIAPELLQDCVQLHGGIGVTWEHDLHLYLRRVTTNRAMYGTPEDHNERIATAILGAA
jgi:alkylation response protein AidB-like acyl-CoA dehydrogenase